jgi:hydroxymethylbilane synthase
MARALQIRLGTRASLLAKWQAEWVAARLRDLGNKVELVPVTTSGDQQQTPIGPVSGSGVFTKEIERELLDGRIDLAVHSLKDLPTEMPAGLALAAVPQRASVADALISHGHTPFDTLPLGASVGTGSLRRRAQLWHARRDLRMLDIRGNVDTRLRKLREGQYDAIILAEAGLDRLALAGQITQVLPLSLLLPAVGQGALGLETRHDDHNVRQAVAQLDHAATHAAVLAERAMLAALRGGCLAPIAAWARVEEREGETRRQGDGEVGRRSHERLLLTGRVLGADGGRQLEAADAAAPEEAEQLGRRVAESLLAQGAAELIAAARSSDTP